MAHQQVRYDLPDRLRVQTPINDLDVAAIGDGGDRGGVGGRTADAVLFEGLDQTRFCEARRRLGEVLQRVDLFDRRGVAFAELRQAALGLLFSVVVTLGVYPREAIEGRPSGVGAQPVNDPRSFAIRRQLNACRLLLLGRHLAGDRSLPDQPIQARLIVAEALGESLRVALERRRPDGLVGLLGVARLGLEGAALGRRVLRTEAHRYDPRRFGNGTHRHCYRVGSHVRDQADLALVSLDAFVEALRRAHGSLGRETELSARFLLQA